MNKASEIKRNYILVGVTYGVVAMAIHWATLMLINWFDKGDDFLLMLAVFGILELLVAVLISHSFVRKGEDAYLEMNKAVLLDLKKTIEELEQFEGDEKLNAVDRILDEGNSDE